MNEIDEELLAAWMSIGAFARTSPREALRRARRMFGDVYRRPMRAWCLAIRASDTRITSHNATILPLPGEMLGPDECGDDLVRQHRAHAVTLTGKTIRRLTQPVFIPRPGLRIAQAARKLGLTRNHLNAWIAAGTVKVSHYERGKWGPSYGGMRRPIVYTPSPIDPNRGAGRPPNPVWGTLWQSHWQEMAEDFRQSFVRVPRFQSIKGRACFNGWEWRCGGRHDRGERRDDSREGPREGQDDSERGCRYFAKNRHSRNGICARACSLLYLPLEVWTMGRSGIAPLRLALPEGCGLAGAWHPGESQSFPSSSFETVADQRDELGVPQPAGPSTRAFAPPPLTRYFQCYHCWGVRGCAMGNRNGWHDFVTLISGGLLHGSEVERSPREAPIFRRRREYKHGPRRTPKRDTVLDGILRGEKYAQIAARTGMTYRAVGLHACSLFKMHGVHSREALRAKLDVDRAARAVAG